MRLLAAVLALASLASASAAGAEDTPSPDEVRPLEAAGRFDEAAALLEQHAAAAAVTPAARAWVDRALDYYLALGDTSSADRALRALAAVAPAEHVAARELALGEVFARQRRWRESAAFHAAWLARRGRIAGAAGRGRAQVAIGNAWRALGDEARALVAYRRARALPRLVVYRGSRGGASGMVSFYGGMYEAGEPPQTLDGREPAPWEAEAMFQQVEPLFRRFVARALPPYRGPASRRAYDRWVHTVLEPAVEARQRELNTFGLVYTAIVNEHASAWEVAAYEHLATLLRSFAEHLHGVSLPPGSNPEFRDAWAAMMHPREDPFFEQALAGFQLCIQRSTRYRDTGSLARCERALFELDARRFPLADELTAAPDQGLAAARDLPAVPRAPAR